MFLIQEVQAGCFAIPYKIPKKLKVYPHLVAMEMEQ